MKAIPSRKVLRWFHFLAGLTLIGYVYLPPANVQPYAEWFKFVYFPIVFVTGMTMWFRSGSRR